MPLLTVDEAHDPREPRDVAFVVDAEILRADAADRGHRGRLGEHERSAADRARAEVDEMPVARESIDARVLTHGADDKTMGERHRAYGERLEQSDHSRTLRQICGARTIRAHLGAPQPHTPGLHVRTPHAEWHEPNDPAWQSACSVSSAHEGIDTRPPRIRRTIAAR
jgi:hypothetical protein